jgi:AcrR family transcriptional regulator
MVQKIKKRDKEETINKIIECTKRLMAKQGYDNVSTNSIAKNLGISVGTLYHHFPKGKVDIVESLFEFDLSLIFAEQILSELYNLSLENALKIFITHIYDIYLTDTYLFRAFNAIFLSNPDIFEKYYQILTKNLNSLVPFIKTFPVMMCYAHVLLLFLTLLKR